MKKVGEDTRPFRYDLTQISYDYTVEETNRFKGLNLVKRIPEELWKEVHNIVQEAVIKTSPPKKEMQEGKIRHLRRPCKELRKKRSERQRIKGKIYPTECRVPENTKER